MFLAWLKSYKLWLLKTNRDHYIIINKNSQDHYDEWKLIVIIISSMKTYSDYYDQWKLTDDHHEQWKDDDNSP